MFTGIVEEMGHVASMTGGELSVVAVTALEGTRVGDSIAVNGTCLTVTRMDDRGFAVDVVPETLRRTNLGGLAPGDLVNLERSLAYGGRVGGHLVQGHVDATGAVAEITPDGDAVLVRYTAPAELLRYVVEKGFVAIDGVSLTVVGLGVDWFSITLIPHTSATTVLGARRVGERVNLEGDILAKYVERLVQGNKGG
jgi:riboflavin synthase